MVRRQFDGQWHGDDWVVEEGLAAGDVVVVDGVTRLTAGAPVNAKPWVAPTAAAATPPATPKPTAKPTPGGLVTSVFFASGSDKLDGAALADVRKAAATLANGALPIAITGYADRTGNAAANANLAKARAKAVRDALAGAGVAPERIRLAAPREVTGGPNDREARRVDIAVAL